MTNKTVLSDEVRQEIKHRYFQGIANNTPVCLMELTEQAVLQSPEIQQLRKDAERLDSGCIMTHERNDFSEEYMCERRGIDLRAAIDAAMEQKC